MEKSLFHSRENHVFNSLRAVGAHPTSVPMCIENNDIDEIQHVSNDDDVESYPSQHFTVISTFQQLCAGQSSSVLFDRRLH